MIYPSADKLENWGNKYALATLAAKRAKQIKSGAPALVETDSRNALTIALEEIAAGKVQCRVPDFDALPTTTVEPEVAQLLSMPIEPDEEAEELIGGAVTSDETSEAVAEEAHEDWEEEEEDEDEVEDLLAPLDDEEEEEEAPAGILGVDDLAAIDDDETEAKVVDDVVDEEVELGADVVEEEAVEPDEEEA